MNPRILVAIVLIVLGVIGLGYQGFTYTTRERVLDIGSIHADVDKQHTVFIAPIVSVLALAGGITLLVISRKSA